MSYEWSDYKRKYYLDGKEIFVESYTISSNEKESIHEIFTVKDRETGISRTIKIGEKEYPYECGGDGSLIVDLVKYRKEQASGGDSK